MSNHQLAKIGHSKYEKYFSHKVRKIQDKYAIKYLVMWQNQIVFALHVCKEKGVLTLNVI